MDVGSFLTEAFSVVTTFGQISTHLKIIGILTLLISFFKVSAFKPLWQKLGWFQTFLAPFLAFILAVVSGINGPLNFHVFFNALLIGFGSVGFHEMLDALKVIPGLGPKWTLIVNFVSQIINDTTTFLIQFFKTNTLPMLLLSMALLGCGEAPIKPDPSLPAMDAHYPTAEFNACNTRWHGLGICEIPSDSTLDTLQFSVQGYLDGDMRVYAVSTDPSCQFDQHLTYIKNQLIPISLPKTSHSCTFGITVTPHFPGQDSQSALQIHSLDGFLRVRKMDRGNLWNGDTFFFPQGSAFTFSIPTFYNLPTVASIRGCGIHFDSLLTPINGRILFDLKDMGLSSTPQVCEIEGALLGLPPFYFSRLIAIYNETFVPLPKPVVLFDRDEITVYADTTVSAMILDDHVILSSMGEFSFDPNQEHVLRLFTISARSVIGEWKPQTQEWTWK